ncbi:coiled-coil domain-containing protein 150 [Nothoprocta perdicaria]|uniref:coiled-coil domain-containing protein 150 n=1 Tax=Nothoprocta perdicaria TaxID=30464 RepID=UPI000E1B910D|nr:coiled-coil domain-containing protein 150 [Nothoprocta perdicaria]
MARPTVSPTSVKATVPEAFVVLRQRMRVAEEEASALARELEALGVPGQSLFHSKALETPASYATVSPVQARVAFVGENTLWKNCESMVSRMCQLESVVQTLKLNIFRLQMEKELNPKHAAQLEQRLNAVQEEHLQEMKVVQQEAMKLRQQLSDMKEAEEKGKDVQRLSAALEIKAAAKMGVAIAAEELRNTNQNRNCRLQDLMEQLSREISLRESLEESQATMMCHVQDMETTVEAERKQVQLLQQDCQELYKDVQLAREMLQEEEGKTEQLKQQCTQLKAELDSKNCIIFQLGEEAKNAQLSLNRQQEENLQLQVKITALQETTEKVQVLNDHLSQQCSDLSTTLQTVAMENVHLISHHQATLKEKMTQQLQEQDSLLDAACADILGELRSVQRERAQLQKELEALHTKHGKCKQKANLKEEAAATQRKLLECTVAKLQDELETALQERGSLLAEKEDLKQEIKTAANEITQERNKLEVEKTENELEMASMKSSLQTLAEENKRLLNRLAALEDQQHAQQKVQQVLAELTNSKNKLAYDKGKLEVANLQRQLEAANNDNSKVTAMLEHVVASHSKTQAALEAVQTELEHKDAEICSLRKERSQSQQKMQILEAELERCQARVAAMGSEHSSQVEPLRKALEVTRADNKKLALRLEQAVQANNTLQNKLIQAQYDLKSKEAEQQQLLVCRKQLVEEAQTKEKTFAERLESLKKQFHMEQEASRKAAHRESAELKKALDEASSKLGEVSRANRELRQKVSELEKSVASYKEKLKGQRIQVRHCLASKAGSAQNAERIKEIESELREMEAIKEQYQKKNYEQSQNIQKFVTELASLQEEMQELLKNQHEMQTRNRQLETHLEAERSRGQQLENQCQRLEETVKHLKKSKEETEQKLKEASIESELITANLEEARRWFKARFDSLQPQLRRNRHAKTPDESSLQREVKHASTFTSKQDQSKRKGEASSPSWAAERGGS